MSEEQVARVYAQALFDAAKEAGVVEPVRRELGDFVAALAASASLRDVLADPQVETTAKQPRARRDHARRPAAAWPTPCSSCWSAAASPRVPELQQAYDALAIVEEGVVEVEVVSAAELSPETEKKIAARVQEATGRRVELARRVDPSILGGLVLRIGDIIVDGSVKARIRQLRRRLATAEVRGDV